MSYYHLYGTLTPKRLAYLLAVEANAPYLPRHASAANNCLRLGWVETVIDRTRGTTEILGQQLTETGILLLESARRSGLTDEPPK